MFKSQTKTHHHSMSLYKLIIPSDLDNISLYIMQSKKLFKGLKFYFIGDFLAAYKNDLVNLIKTAGGIVIESEDALERHSHLFNEGPLRNPLVVYNDDPKQKCNPGEESYIVEMRSKEAEKLTARIDSWAIPPSWILDSIAACELKQVPSRAYCL